jgi:peptidoglycan/xylan/chitin deacetylase (PgdA/CDA1 family)
MLETSDLSELNLPIRLQLPIRFNLARTVAEGVVRPVLTSKEFSEEFTEFTGVVPEEVSFSTRIFEFDLQEHDHVIMQADDSGMPLIICRDEEVIVNFDMKATQSFQFRDSKRPAYTYLRGFNVQMIPDGIRRPLSNFVHSLSSSKRNDVIGKYRRLPLTGFECVILLLNKVLVKGTGCETQAFQWPSGKRAVFVSLHDIDTGGFLRRRENDPLFRLEQKHEIKAVWFVPTGLLKGNNEAIDFLIQSGNEVGWHGHKHDHRLPYRPFADQRVTVLRKSILAAKEKYPLGMRTPKLLKSNYLFEVLDRTCPALCYDTSFLHGIVPYHLWLNGRRSSILEIPTTIPTDIAIYNQLRGVPRSRKPEIILQAQIARTEKIIEAGGVISIVTHPEKHLTERPDFLEVYDQYLAYIKGRSDIWFTTAGELFKYWTHEGPLKEL